MFKMKKDPKINTNDLMNSQPNFFDGCGWQINFNIKDYIMDQEYCITDDKYYQITPSQYFIEKNPELVTSSGYRHQTQ